MVKDTKPELLLPHDNEHRSQRRHPSDDIAFVVIGLVIIIPGTASTATSRTWSQRARAATTSQI
eukprot:3509793-Rhodomonas_salina.1